jgi:hypothetical protein
VLLQVLVTLARAQRALVRPEWPGIAALRHVAQLRPREFRRLAVAFHEPALGLSLRFGRVGETGGRELRASAEHCCNGELHHASTAQDRRAFAADMSEDAAKGALPARNLAHGALGIELAGSSGLARCGYTRRF